MQVFFRRYTYSAIVNLKKNRNCFKFHRLGRGQKIWQKDQRALKMAKIVQNCHKKRKTYLPDHDNGEIQNVPGTPQVRCRMLP